MAAPVCRPTSSNVKGLFGRLLSIGQSFGRMVTAYPPPPPREYLRAAAIAKISQQYRTLR